MKSRLPQIQEGKAPLSHSPGFSGVQVRDALPQRPGKARSLPRCDLVPLSITCDCITVVAISVFVFVISLPPGSYLVRGCVSLLPSTVPGTPGGQ